jgi:hypothetical protein
MKFQKVWDVLFWTVVAVALATSITMVGLFVYVTGLWAGWWQQ